MSTFGKRLKQLRENKELTQQELAECLSVNRDALAKWETDKAFPDINMIKDIAVFFGVTTDYLIGKDDQTFEMRVADVIRDNMDLLNQAEQEFLMDMIVNYIETVKNRDKRV